MRFARSTLLTIALALMVSASPSSAKCRFDVPESTMKSAHIVYTGGPGFSPARRGGDRTGALGLRGQSGPRRAGV